MNLIILFEISKLVVRVCSEITASLGPLRAYLIGCEIFVYPRELHRLYCSIDFSHHSHFRRAIASLVTLRYPFH